MRRAPTLAPHGIEVSYAPIAVLAYNRPRHFARAVQALGRDPLARNSDLWVFCDGARASADAQAVGEVRDLAQHIDGFRSVSVVQRKENLGLASSVVSAVTQLCAQHGRAIVLEDDLLVSGHFLSYMNAALDRYADEPRVMSISAYMYPVSAPNRLPDAFFCRFPSSWGWATWQRAWGHFEPDGAGLLARLDASGSGGAFDLEGSYPYRDHMAKQASGELDVWAVRWYASMFLRNGLCLFPSRSLVQNGGMDGSGMHCGPSRAFDVAFADAAVSSFPEVIEECEPAVRQIGQFLASLSESRLRRVFRRTYAQLQQLMRA